MSSSSEQFITESLGGFGRYQLRLCFIIGFAIVSCTGTFMVMTFSTAEPPWRCTVNSTTCTINGTFKPGDKHYEHRCSIPRQDWEFAVEGKFDSIVTEWDLVCDRSVYSTIANSCTFLAMLIGASIGSILSDKFGRKTLAIPGVVTTCLCGFISAFATEYWVFALFRSILGLGAGVYSASTFTLLMEYIGASYRARVGVGIFYFWSLGMFMLALLGYLIQSWRTISMIVSAPGVLFFLFWWVTPESLRWLMTKGKVEEAKDLFRKIAQVNQKELTEEDIALLVKITSEEVANVKRHGDVRDLFATRQLTMRTLISWYAWFVCSMVYFGIFLGAPSLGGNMYLNFFIISVCEAVGTTISIIVLDKFGRRRSIMTTIWSAGMAMIMVSLLTYYDDGSKGFLIGKFLATQVIGIFSIVIVYGGLFVYSSELFPTVVRNTGLGTSNAAGRIGSACTPYILYSVRVHPLMPTLLMGAFAVICGCLFFMLPETYNKVMPDTVQQVDKEDVDQDVQDTAL